MKLYFPGWDRFQPTVDLSGPRMWVKLWRQENGSFAQLPLIARGLFNEILKLADDHGVVDIGSKSPADAIAFALGADRADRRALAKYVPMLIADGCIELRSDRDEVTSEPRSDHEATTTAPRTDHEPTTNEPRSDHETEAKYAKSYDGTDRALVNYKSREEEKTRNAGAREAPDSRSRRWAIFEAAWRSRHGGLGLGLCGPPQLRDIGRLEQRFETIEAWQAECEAFADGVVDAASVHSPWKLFTSQAGSWVQRAKRSASSGVAPVTPEEDRGPPDDPAHIFDHIKRRPRQRWSDEDEAPHPFPEATEGAA